MLVICLRTFRLRLVLSGTSLFLSTDVFSAVTHWFHFPFNSLHHICVKPTEASGNLALEPIPSSQVSDFYPGFLGICGQTPGASGTWGSSNSSRGTNRHIREPKSIQQSPPSPPTPPPPHPPLPAHFQPFIRFILGAC